MCSLSLSLPSLLNTSEDELLRVYETDGLWLLVRKQGADELGDGQGKLGYVPANYVDEVSSEIDWKSDSFAYRESNRVGRKSRVASHHPISIYLSITFI